MKKILNFIGIISLIGVFVFIEYILSLNALSLLIIYFVLPTVLISISPLITDERKGEGFQLTAIVLFACIAIGIAMGNQELAEELKRIFMVDFQIEKYDCDNESVRKVSYDSDRFLENIGVASVLIIIFSIPTATIILLKIIGNHFYKIDKWENPYKSK